MTRGRPEAVAARHRFVNLAIPGYNRKVWERQASMFCGQFDWPGVTETYDAETWVKNAGRLRLEDFAVDQDAWRRYAEHYCGPMDGRHSARVIRAIEQQQAGVSPAAMSRDAKGFIHV